MISRGAPANSRAMMTRCWFPGQSAYHHVGVGRPDSIPVNQFDSITPYPPAVNKSKPVQWSAVVTAECEVCRHRLAEDEPYLSPVLGHVSDAKIRNLTYRKTSQISDADLDPSRRSLHKTGYCFDKLGLAVASDPATPRTSPDRTESVASVRFTG